MARVETNSDMDFLKRVILSVVQRFMSALWTFFKKLYLTI